ncbi:MAG: hypothetical protein MHM6MM_006752, partial [Cercozoa sp. M6MM]
MRLAVGLSLCLWQLVATLVVQACIPDSLKRESLFPVDQNILLRVGGSGFWLSHKITMEVTTLILQKAL